MEIAAATSCEATRAAIGHVEREAGYLFHFRRNTSNFSRKTQQLGALRIDIQTKVDAANDRDEVIKKTVQEWVTRVDVALAQAKQLSEEAGTINRWFKGWCCFCFFLCQTDQAQELSDQEAIDSSCCCKRWCCAHFSLGRRAKKDIIIIQGIFDEGIAFGTDVSDRKPTKSLKLVGQDFNAFASTVSTAEEIHKALLDDAINLVGVHGMPGVEKTTLIKEIVKQVKEEQLFQEVVVVIVSQNPDLIKVQEDIAEGLDMELSGHNLCTRAQRLSERLEKNTKTTLIVLDDLWGRIELSEVGIPCKNEGRCCKVVFTTRDQAVCDKMEANTQIEVALLSQQDSWVLFCQKVGTVADYSIAPELLNECKRLPLAIITLGLALRNKNENVCVDALQQLRKSIFEGMSPVNSSIKLSYNFLGNESTRICFLFCCLFPEDHRIKLDALLSYVMGEKLLEDVDTYEEARGRLYGITDKLVSSGLLLSNENGDIMMHDVVRDMAISIAMKVHGFIVKAGRNLRNWPDMELGTCKRLSMMHNSIKQLSAIQFQMKAPHLQALFLNNNDRLSELPSDIFADMKNLMVLDLSRTNLKSLPPSLCCLQNLRTLLLNKTGLTTVSPIDKLKRLEVLSLCFSLYIGEFPEEMQKLSNLRILDLTGTSLRSIKPNLISKLHRLEVFHFLTPKPNRGIDFFQEVGSLSQLTSLELLFDSPDRCNIEIPGSWDNLTRFQIMVGFRMEIVGVSTFMRSLWLEIRRKQVANWVLVLLGRTNYLHLNQCNYLQCVTELGAKGMNDNLKSLVLRNCPKMECLFSSMGSLVSEENTFSNLEELEIIDMSAFVEICKGTTPLGLLQKLRKLTLKKCHGLLTATPRKLIQNLLNLEYLKIEYCTNLLYMDEEEDEESLVSNMSRISEPLPLPRFPNLKVLLMERIKIKYVFTMRVARNLLLLEALVIIDCPEMEVIFKYADGEDIICGEDNKDNDILPRLKDLSIWTAPKLQSFTTHNLLMELPSLEYLKVYNCGNLERLPFGTTGAPNLKTFVMDQKLLDKLEWEAESVKSRFVTILL